MNLCKDCSKKIYPTSIRCKACSVTKRNKSMSYRSHMRKVMKGRIISWDILKERNTLKNLK